MRVYNFSAGPSVLPEEVLRQVQADMLDYEGSGMSVVEMSHRGKVFSAINDEAHALLRELMNVPENYDIIFVQGGASTQFEAIPMNLLGVNNKADYILTGNWSNKAFSEGKKYGDFRVVADSKDRNYAYVPKTKPSDFRPDAKYVHITSNNTIYGTRYVKFPDTNNIPIVADMSSDILATQVDVSKFGVIYAGTQKNVAPAGATIVIIRKDLTENVETLPFCPTMLKWTTQIKEKSLYNTPPSFSIYVAMLVFRHLKKLGGVKEMEKINLYKAGLLYDYLDESRMFKSTVDKADRSLMNIPFVTGNEELDNKFIKEAEKTGLNTLKGYKTVGGMRASIYNAMPVEGVKELVKFMKDFEVKNK